MPTGCDVMDVEKHLPCRTPGDGYAHKENWLRMSCLACQRAELQEKTSCVQYGWINKVGDVKKVESGINVHPHNLYEITQKITPVLRGHPHYVKVFYRQGIAR